MRKSLKDSNVKYKKHDSGMTVGACAAVTGFNAKRIATNADCQGASHRRAKSQTRTAEANDNAQLIQDTISQLDKTTH